MNILIASLKETLQQTCILILPGLILTFTMNYVSGRLEVVGSRMLGARLYMILFGWLGTSIHELSHALMCMVFRHRINKLQFFNLNPNSAHAGYVAHSYNAKSLYQRIGNLFIGVAPILLGAIVIYLSAKVLLPEITPKIRGSNSLAVDLPVLLWSSFLSFVYAVFDFNHYSQVEFYMFLYIMFCVGSSMKLSKADLIGARHGFITFLAVLFIMNIAINSISPSWGYVLSGFMSSITQQGFFIHNTMAIVLLMNILLLGQFRLFARNR